MTSRLLVTKHLDENLGREVPGTLDIFATSVLDSLSEDPATGTWGATASVIGYSREALQRRSGIVQTPVRGQSFGRPREGERLGGFPGREVEQARRQTCTAPSSYRLFHPQMLYTRVPSHWLDDIQSMNESVAPSIESHTLGQAVQDAYALERQYMMMPEPTIYTGQQYPQLSVQCDTRFINCGVAWGLGGDFKE